MVSTRSGNKAGHTASKGKRTISANALESASDHADKPTPIPSDQDGRNHKDGDAFRSDVVGTMNRLLGKLTSAESTICPSQIPRALKNDQPQAARYRDWRALMQPTREIVWQEVKAGRAEVTQGGEVRSYEQRHELKGPIRVRKGPQWDGR